MTTPQEPHQAGPFQGEEAVGTAGQPGATPAGPPTAAGTGPSWAAPAGWTPDAWSSQPGWHQPPPNAQTGWQNPYALAQPRSNHRGCLIGAFVAIGLVAVLVVGCVAVLTTVVVPAVTTALNITRDSSGRVSSTSYNNVNGRAEFRIFMAPGIPDAEGPDIACNVVRPDLQGGQFAGTEFEVFDATGIEVASDSTPCH